MPAPTFSCISWREPEASRKPACIIVCFSKGKRKKRPATYPNSCVCLHDRLALSSYYIVCKSSRTEVVRSFRSLLAPSCSQMLIVWSKILRNAVNFRLCICIYNRSFRFRNKRHYFSTADSWVCCKSWPLQVSKASQAAATPPPLLGLHTVASSVSDCSLTRPS